MKWGTPDIVAVTFKDYINKSVHINLPNVDFDNIYLNDLKNFLENIFK